MATPKYSADPITDFLRRLKEEGFIGWFSFEFGANKSAFWKALAHGIQLHSEISYPSGEGHFLSKKWLPRVQPILTVSQQYCHDPQKVVNPLYWSALGSACQTLATDILRSSGKDHLTTDIERGGLPDKALTSVYEILVSALNLCICWYECRADQTIVTDVFHPKTKGELGLFITLAQEGDRLYFLYHKETQGEIRVEFPFAMKVGGTGKPLVLGSGNKQREERDPKDVLIGHLMKIIQASASLTLASADHLPPSASEPLSHLHERIRSTTAYISSAKLETALPDPVTQLLSLRAPERQIVPVSAIHTIINCEEYPEVADYVEFHSHKFHRNCMARYLEGLQPSFPQMPRCPVEGCGVTLPDSALDLNATVRDIYVRMRQASTEKAIVAREYALSQSFSSQSSQSQSSQSQSSQSQSSQSQYYSSPSLPIMTLTQCLVCSCRYNNQYFMSHGCSLCVKCAYRDYSFNNGVCSQCGSEFNQVDLQRLRMHYENTIRRGAALT